VADKPSRTRLFAAIHKTAYLVATQCLYTFLDNPAYHNYARQSVVLFRPFFLAAVLSEATQSSTWSVRELSRHRKLTQRVRVMLFQCENTQFTVQAVSLHISI